jgi:hypothetical protein
MRARVRVKKTTTASVKEKKKNDHPTRVACLAFEKGKEIAIPDAYAERKKGQKEKPQRT